MPNGRKDSCYLAQEDEMSYWDGVSDSSPFNSSEIDVASVTLSLDSVIERMQCDEIDLNTDFQRRAEIWTVVQMSRLIESILIQLPLPVFYFDVSSEYNWQIIDGLQRLNAIKRFVLDKERPLKLKGLEFLSAELNGATYDDLPRPMQRRFREFQIITHQVRPSTPLNIKYSIFMRVNTGGTPLNSQEIRHALAPTHVREFLARCSEYPDFIELMGDRSRRMKDQELVLRFVAYEIFNSRETARNLVVLLNEAVERLRRADRDELDRLARLFALSLERSKALFGSEAFVKHLFQEGSKKRKSVALFEVWMRQLSKLSESDFSKLCAKRDRLLHELDETLTDNQDFIRSLSTNTQAIQNIEYRHAVTHHLVKIILRET